MMECMGYAIGTVTNTHNFIAYDRDSNEVFDLKSSIAEHLSALREIVTHPERRIPYSGLREFQWNI